MVNVGPDPKTLKKAWNEFLKNNYDFKLKGIGLFANKDLMQVEEVRVAVISNEPVNFFTHVVEDGTGSEMKVFASDQQEYLSKRYMKNGFQELADMLTNFLKSYLPQYHRSKINDMELVVTELTEETKDLEDEISENLESIEELEEEIEEMKEELQSNRIKLEESKNMLEHRKAKLQRKSTALQEL